MIPLLLLRRKRQQARKTLKQAIVAALIADPTISALVGTRINPQKVSAKNPYPALRFKVSPRTWNEDLDGADGTATSKVEFTAEASKDGEADALILAVRNLFQDLEGDFYGIQIDFVNVLDDGDDYSDAEDSSDKGTYLDAITIQFTYQIDRPSR